MKKVLIPTVVLNIFLILFSVLNCLPGPGQGKTQSPRGLSASFFDPFVALDCKPKTISGSDVTVIGDSITVRAMSFDLYEKYLPGADVHAENGKRFSTDAPGGNLAGTRILRDLKFSGRLRKFVVFALGTNQPDLTPEDIDEVLELAGWRTVIFVNNFTLKNDYSSNDRLFSLAAENNKNVRVVDWRSVIKNNSGYLPDGVHPDEAGAELFVSAEISVLNEFADPVPKECEEHTVGRTALESVTPALLPRSSE